MTVYKNIKEFYRSDVKPMLPQTGDILMKANIPKGQEDYYLKCDGKEYSRLEEEELFKVIGVTYGEGDGKNTFNVPDYRGLVPRGLDEGREIDKDRKLGTHQLNQNKSHLHIANSKNSGKHIHNASSGVVDDHKHVSPWGEGNGGGFWGTYSSGREGSNATDYDNRWNYTSPAGKHSHSISVDEDGVHLHEIIVKSDGGVEARMENISTLFYIRKKTI